MPIYPTAPANPGSGGPYYSPTIPPSAPPPIPSSANKQLQGTLSIGSNTLITCPDFFYCRIGLRFNNPIAYDITLSITRGPSSPTPGTLQCYSLTLSAGDTVEDQGYLLARGDSIVVDTTTAGTNYFITLNYTPGY